MTGITPDALIDKHGHDAPDEVDRLIAHAIKEGEYDEALRLDRVRRRVEHLIARQALFGTSL